MEERVIVCDSVSKRWSACGIRIGCLVSRNQDFLQTAVRLARARLSAPYLGQVAVAAIPEIRESYMEETVAEYRQRRDTVLEALDGVPGLMVPRPRGAFYTMLRLPVESSEDFARWLLTDFEYQGETVMVSPGPGFYLSEGMGRDEVRLAFMVSSDRLKRAANCLVRALEVYPGRIG
jgi:aspartate aminotransferase